MREVSARNASRNIPTCVGKTGAVEADGVTDEETSPPAWGKLQASSPVEDSVETSPPAWGKLKKKRRLRAMCRNIPTCVGKTQGRDRGSGRCRKHPHLRGENTRRSSPLSKVRETSPPAWGKLILNFCLRCLIRKHPHLRGENLSNTPNDFQRVGKHPHLRGENSKILS